jgi:hypothetical protein
MLMLCFFQACSKIPERNKIVFRDSVSVVQDSVRTMSYLMTKMREKEVKNYFFTNDDSLVINNRRIGRMSNGDSINFIKIVKEETGISENESLRLISLALYLKDNFINGCFKHRVFGVYFYVYRQTLANENSDQRYILLNDEKQKAIKGSGVESYKLLDQKYDLLLVAPAD